VHDEQNVFADPDRIGALGYLAYSLADAVTAASIPQRSRAS
jgi:hypothetical protein